MHIPARIAETDDTNANESKEGLLEKIISRDNLNEAFKRDKANKGSHGIDGMGGDELLQYLKENGETIKEQILAGKLLPQFRSQGLIRVYIVQVNSRQVITE